MDPRKSLIELLRSAYSGELAAALAYRGHARSLADVGERERVRQIEKDEWHHRRIAGQMLHDLGEAPRPAREWQAGILGRSLGALCRVAGWFLPMYAAGLLEGLNVREYEEAAKLAEATGRRGWVDRLRDMARVESEHEAYFKGRVRDHPWTRILSPRRADL
ncbi:MAG TPA: ferritin-like domain-containing protein [Planctomycetota bacterium]|nr:ferritin-like domain-containing protein [Planctomycetota bacterium]